MAGKSRCCGRSGTCLGHVESEAGSSGSETGPEVEIRVPSQALVLTVAAPEGRLASPAFLAATHALRMGPVSFQYTAAFSCFYKVTDAWPICSSQLTAE